MTCDVAKSGKTIIYPLELLPQFVWSFPVLVQSDWNLSSHLTMHDQNVAIVHNLNINIQIRQCWLFRPK